MEQRSLNTIGISNSQIFFKNPQDLKEVKICNDSNQLSADGALSVQDQRISTPCAIKFSTYIPAFKEFRLFFPNRLANVGCECHILQLDVGCGSPRERKLMFQDFMSNIF